LFFFLKRNINKKNKDYDDDMKRRSIIFNEEETIAIVILCPQQVSEDLVSHRIYFDQFVNEK
jgi:hypothetical protein